MTFTELEYVLMLCCVVMAWRVSVVTAQRNSESERANRYTRFMVGIYNNEGKVVKKNDGFYYEEFNKSSLDNHV